jgi:hypothetical protein
MNDADLESLVNMSRGPRFTPPPPPPPKPKYVLPAGMPQLDAAWEAAYGPPVDHNDAKARQYLRDNPHVWSMMVSGARKMIELNRRFSFKTLVEVARWYHLNDQTKDRFSDFKLSNSYTAFIARYCRHFYPILDDLVEIHD